MASWFHHFVMETFKSRTKRTVKHCELQFMMIDRSLIDFMFARLTFLSVTAADIFMQFIQRSFLLISTSLILNRLPVLCNYQLKWKDEDEYTTAPNDISMLSF